MNPRRALLMARQPISIITLALVLLSMLTQCAPAPTYAEAQATAQAGGCWPAYLYPTPPVVTVTPVSTPIATPGIITTPLPTTTPYPICPVPPGTTPIPWPSPVPPAPPYPTMEPRRWLTGSDAHTTFQLADTAYAIDLAVHPTEGWPVVGVLQRLNLTTDPIHAFVRVYNPRTRTWSVAQQVDVGAASNGTDRFGSIVVGVTGDRAVHAVWGSSDDDGGLWTSSSTDFGARWSAPQRIATNCWFANAMATTPDGQIVVEASCYDQRDAPQPRATLIIRTADDTWLPQESTDVPGWFGTIVLAGDGRDALATAFVTAKGTGVNEQVIYILSKYLVNRGAPWQIRQIAVEPLDVPAGEAGESH